MLIDVKLNVFICLCLLLTVMARNIKDVSPQLKAVEKLATDTIKLINEGATEGDNELKRLQATSNIFQMYVQDAIHYFHGSIDKLTDTDLLEQFVPFVRHLQEVAYGMAKSNNMNASIIKKNLSNAMKGYLKLIPQAEQLITGASKKNAEMFALNLNKHSYDIALFMYETVYIEVRFRRETRKAIGEHIEQNLITVFKLLDCIKDVSAEFVGFSQLLPEFCDRIVHKTERWAYLSRLQNSTNDDISSVPITLGELVRQFRKNMRSKSSTVQSIVKDLFVNAAPELRKLSLAAETLSQQEQELYKDILLEILSVISTIEDQLKIVSGKSCNDAKPDIKNLLSLNKLKSVI